ncbi:MAG: MBL fold metallo-hydrolase [Clostridia bacterium]|nr:MBL fold metallo-hydrolase [Clostridia bacterium]
MATKKPVNSKNQYSKNNTSKKKKRANNKPLIIALTIIVVIILIIAIILISIKGIWNEVIQLIKSLLNADDLPSGDLPSGSISSGNVSNKPVPSGIAELHGDILEMRVLDIGQGDCILLIFPDGQVMVMDIGSEVGKPSPWNVIHGALQELEITTIDYLFLTHTDYDHIRETKKLIDNYQIKNFYLPRADLDLGKTWRDAYNSALSETYIEDGNTKQAVINENVGAYEISGENWIMKCYSFDEADYPVIKNGASATNKNAVSPICLLEYSGRTIVLTGDSNEKNEPYLISKGYFDDVDADVLKVAHHGSRTSTSMDFLNKVDCEYAIISCGADNDYGHPTPEALDRLNTYIDLVPDDDYIGYAQVYRTDEDGTVTVQIDEDGVMNLIADENESKNTTTGTPIGETESGEVASGEVVLFCVKQNDSWLCVA